MAFDKLSIKYDGRSWEFNVADLDVPSENLRDHHIMSAVSQKLEDEGCVNVNLSPYTVDPPESERLAGLHNEKTVLNVRPRATLA